MPTICYLKQQMMQWSLQWVFFQYLWFITFSLFSPLVSYSSSWQQLKICQKRRTHELVVTAVINTSDKSWQSMPVMSQQSNSLSTISYSCTVVRTIYVKTPVRFPQVFNGQTCEFCMLHLLNSLDNPFGIFACKPVLDMNQKSTLYKYVIEKEDHFLIKGDLGHQYLVTSIPHFCKYEMMYSEHCTDEMVGTLFTWI